MLTRPRALTVVPQTLLLAAAPAERARSAQKWPLRRAELEIHYAGSIPAGAILKNDSRQTLYFSRSFLSRNQRNTSPLRTNADQKYRRFNCSPVDVFGSTSQSG